MLTFGDSQPRLSRDTPGRLFAQTCEVIRTHLFGCIEPSLLARSLWMGKAYSLEMIAEYTGAGKRTVEGWLAGERPPTAYHLNLLYDLLGADFKNAIESFFGFVSARTEDVHIAVGPGLAVNRGREVGEIMERAAREIQTLITPRETPRAVEDTG